jgi:hypothetical protein
MRCAARLLARDRRGRDAATVVAGGVERESAPARADLDDVVVRLQPQRAADVIQPRQLRLVQAHLLTFEDGRGVHHRLVQPQRKEIVAEVVVRRDVEVVVRRDVAPRPLVRVAINPVEQPLQQARESGRAALHAVQHLAVPEQQPDQRDEVVALPVAVHPGLAAADGSAERHLAVKPRIQHSDMRSQHSVPQPGQLTEHAAARQVVQHGRLDRAGEMPWRCQRNGFHCTSFSAGARFAG